MLFVLKQFRKWQMPWDARYDPEVRVIILPAKGDNAFCSGGDQRVRGDHEGLPGRAGPHHLNVLDFQRGRSHLP